MKRDARLQGLSSDHHQALVLARRTARGELDAAEVRARFDRELAPHFAIEEELLLPALDDAALVARTTGDHAAIRDALARGDLAAFAERITSHVRFEERELFPACEARVPADVLDAVSRRCPHP
jgi:hypothetical protein